MADNDMEKQEKKRQDGENVKCLIGTFRTTQSKIAKTMRIPDSTLSDMLSQDIIGDEDLDKIAEALGNGITREDIKNYDHEQTKAYIINNVFSGGKAFNSGSNNNEKNITNELAFIEKFEKKCEEIAELKQTILYYRMKYEAEKVTAEREG